MLKIAAKSFKFKNYIKIFPTYLISRNLIDIFQISYIGDAAVAHQNRLVHHRDEGEDAEHTLKPLRDAVS